MRSTAHERFPARIAHRVGSCTHMMAGAPRLGGLCAACARGTARVQTCSDRSRLPGCQQRRFLLARDAGTHRRLPLGRQSAEPRKQIVDGRLERPEREPRLDRARIADGAIPAYGPLLRETQIGSSGTFCASRNSGVTCVYVGFACVTFSHACNMASIVSGFAGPVALNVPNVRDSARRIIHSPRSRPSMNCTGSAPSPGTSISPPCATRCGQ